MLVTPFEWLADQIHNTFRDFDDIKVEFELLFPDSVDKFDDFVNEIVN